MKKKTEKIKGGFESQCFVSQPPWYKKTREASWRIGYNGGVKEGRASMQQEFEQEKKKLLSQDDRNKALNDVLKSMGQALDAMAHAILYAQGGK